VTATAEALWSRALHVAQARGLLPVHRASLTPGEVAAEVARRGEDRLARLVDGWYYAASYGRARGALSDEEAVRLVAALEAGIGQHAIASEDVSPAETATPASETPSRKRGVDCELCGAPRASSP